MSLGLLQLAETGDAFAVLVWVAIILGPALLKILKKVTSAAAGGAASSGRPSRPTRSHRQSAGPASDLGEGAERWRRLLAGEEALAPSPPKEAPVAVPTVQAKGHRRLADPEARARHSAMPAPDEGQVLPPDDEAYAVSTDAYAIQGRGGYESESEPSRLERPERPAASRGAARVPAPLGFDRRSLRAGILWSEILAPPLALRGPEVPGGPAGPGGEAHV